MRAVVCEELGPVDKLVFKTDWVVSEPGPDQVLIDVKSCGLNFPDTLIIEGKYQTKPPLPFVPGGECAGVIAAVGENVTQYSVGDKVVVVGSHGAFAEQLVCNAAGVLPMPNGLSFNQASGIGITYFTSYYALKQRADLQPGETVLVLGAAGGVGITAVEIAKAMGATVIAAASSEEKLQLAKLKGADHLINYTEQDLKASVKELTGGRGVDVIYDPVGGEYAEMALRCMAWKGRFLVIGFANGEIPKIPLNLALLKGCDIRGVFWGAFTSIEADVQKQNVADLWAMFENGELTPVVTDSFPIENYVEAFNCLSQRRAKGKVILEINNT